MKFTVSFLLFVCAFSSPSIAQESPLSNVNFSDMDTPTLKKWLLENYSGTTNIKQDVQNGEFKNATSYSNGVVRTVHLWKKADQVRLDRYTKQPEKEETHYITISRKDGFLSMVDHGEVYSVVELRKGEEQASIESAMNDYALALSAAGSIFDISVYEFIHDEHFSVEAIQQINEKNVDLIKVDWKYINPDIRSYGWLLFEPNDKWRLHEFARGNLDRKSSTAFCRKVHYSENSDFPSSIEEGQITKDRATFTQEMTTEVLLATTDAPSETVFELAQFGLPDVLSAEEKSPSPWRWWLLGITIIALAGWIITAKLRART